MGGAALLVSSPGAAAYDLGEGHPMRAVRAELATGLARSLGVLDRPAWTFRDAEPARRDELSLVHTDVYVAMVQAAERLSPRMLAAIGLGSEDTPVIPGLHAAASAVVGATLAACAAVWSGEVSHAVNLTGGLHHAMSGHASGFCVYNDAAVGIADLLRSGCPRIAYIDLDAHHGDGVEAAFADEARVLTISIHQDGRTLFPGSGAARDDGGVVDLPVPPGSGDEVWLHTLTEVLPDRLRHFAPTLIVTQCGCDGHARDPLSDLRLSVEGFTTAYELVHSLAHEVCAGRWVVLGGGGYDLGHAVPRAWTQLLAVCSGAALEPPTTLPEPWRTESRLVTGRDAPQRLGDGR